MPLDPPLDPATPIWVKFLQMPAPPAPAAASLPVGVVVDRVDEPDLDVYRTLYRQVGDAWFWLAHRRLREPDLRAVLEHQRRDLLIVSRDGEALGFSLLDLRHQPDVEIVYFGLRDVAMGGGVGGALMSEVQRRAWASGAQRLWLHTCQLDHPNAVPFYQHLGFEVYDEKSEMPPDPRERFEW